MKIVVNGIVEEARGGYTARATRLRLVGFGVDALSAVRQLSDAVEAWAVSLERGGWLEQAVERTGVEHYANEGRIEVEVRPSETTGEAKASALPLARHSE